jgi:hypothetical protein
VSHKAAVVLAHKRRDVVAADQAGRNPIRGEIIAAGLARGCPRYSERRYLGVERPEPAARRSRPAAGRDAG